MNTDDYIRIPFKDHGRTREGADCWGLACIIFKEQLGIDLPTFTDYADTKDQARISEMIKSESISWQSIGPMREKAFDMAVFRMMGQPMHVGVVIKPGLMIHCERGCGVYLTEYYKENQWDRRLEGFYRYATGAGITPTVPSTQENA
jgi:cell wall-associated NlpC family hydrolase